MSRNMFNNVENDLCLIKGLVIIMKQISEYKKFICRNRQNTKIFVIVPKKKRKSKARTKRTGFIQTYSSGLLYKHEIHGCPVFLKTSLFSYNQCYFGPPHFCPLNSPCCVSMSRQVLCFVFLCFFSTADYNTQQHSIVYSQ